MAENRIRIREAVAFARSRGKKINKTALAGKVFPYRSEKSAYTCLNNYERGHTRMMDRIQITTICRELSVDPNFLFGWKEPMLNTNTQNDGESESITGTSEGS